jgi:hypothetical protein
MREEDTHTAAHDYTKSWCEAGEIGHVTRSGGGRVRYVRVGTRRWS